MASQEEKAKCVLWIHESHSAAVVQRSFTQLLERNLQLVPHGMNSLKRQVACAKGKTRKN
jgi:hypothetical protein